MSHFSQQKLSAIAGTVRDVAVFCIQFGGHLYAGWPADRLFKYLSFQLLNNCLVVARVPDIAGIFIAWPDYAAEIQRRQAAGEYAFAWRPPVRGGDAYMIADVIVNQDENVLSRLVQMASERWPDWKMRRIYTHRRGKLIELSKIAVHKFLVHHGRRPIHSGSF